VQNTRIYWIFSAHVLHHARGFGTGLCVCFSSSFSMTKNQIMEFLSVCQWKCFPRAFLNVRGFWKIIWTFLSTDMCFAWKNMYTHTQRYRIRSSRTMDGNYLIAELTIDQFYELFRDWLDVDMSKPLLRMLCQRGINDNVADDETHLYPRFAKYSEVCIASIRF